MSYEYNKDYAKKYIGETYDEIKLRVPKGRKSGIEARAKSVGQSLTGYINALIRADMGLTEHEWKHGQP